MTRLARVLAVLGVGIAVAAAPTTALAHALNPTYESQLPLVVYLAGAGLAVALSFAFVLVRDLRAEPPPANPRTFELAKPVAIGLRALGLIGWTWIVAQGIVGGSSDADVGTLFVWVYTWVGVAMLSVGLLPSVVLAWIALNAFVFLNKGFDPYPFILLNLILSCLAAIQAPIIMMSQNRSEARDRLRADNDYKVNLKAELEIRHLHEKIDHLLRRQYNRLFEIQQMQIDLLEELNQRGRARTSPPAP